MPVPRAFLRAWAFVLTSLLALAGSVAAATDLEQAAIGRIAATLPPGAFAKLDTGLPAGVSALKDLFRVRVDDGRRLSIDGWTDSAHWDPRRKRTFFIGMRQYKKFISYDALANVWRELGWEGEPPPKFERFGHVYGRTALDAKRGHYYWLAQNNVLHRYRIDEARWEAIAGVPIRGYLSMEWHEGVDKLVAVNPGHEVVGFRDGAAAALGRAAVHGYHSVGRYNRSRGDMLFAGGNQSPRKLTVVTRTGAIEDRGDAPFDITIKHASLTYDPASGNYLLMRGNVRQLYEYQPDRDEWRLAADWGEAGWPFSRSTFYTPIVIDELGVILWQSEGGIYLYRHRSAFREAGAR